ncbi:hypothetical protein SAI_0753, partial [Streptococcus agalactiae H36B]
PTAGHISLMEKIDPIRTDEKSKMIFLLFSNATFIW